MKSDRELIIITRQFPYGNKESFLESEILILSKYFTNIIIYPSTKTNSVRSIPDNVIIKDDICNNYESKRIWIPKTLSSAIFYKTLFKYVFKLKNRKSAIDLFKYTTSYTIYLHFFKSFFRYNSNVIIYSYWYSSVVDPVIKTRDNLSKIVCRVHRGDLYEEMTCLGFFPFRKENISKIDKIYSISNDGLVYLKNRYNVNNTIVSKLGIFDKLALNQIDKSLFSIVSVSNIIPVKRVDLIARSIIQLAISSPSLNIVWNHFGDGIEFENVNSIIAAYKLPNMNCKFNGIVSNQVIYNYYSSNPVNVFINLSKSEGIPVSIMEATSFGIPIIATNVGGVSEIVSDCNGYLLSENPTIQDVIDAFRLLQSNTKDRSKIKHDWLNNYSADVNYTFFAHNLISLS